MVPQGTGMRLSAFGDSGRDILFGKTPDGIPEFQSFSPERLFGLTGGSVVELEFRDPAAVRLIVICGVCSKTVETNTETFWGWGRPALWRRAASQLASRWLLAGRLPAGLGWHRNRSLAQVGLLDGCSMTG